LRGNTNSILEKGISENRAKQQMMSHTLKGDGCRAGGRMKKKKLKLVPSAIAIF